MELGGHPLWNGEFQQVDVFLLDDNWVSGVTVVGTIEVDTVNEGLSEARKVGVVYNHWTGLVDWTSGLTLKVIFYDFIVLNNLASFPGPKRRRRKGLVSAVRA